MKSRKNFIREIRAFKHVIRIQNRIEDEGVDKVKETVRHYLALLKAPDTARHVENMRTQKFHEQQAAQKIKRAA